MRGRKRDLWKVGTVLVGMLLLLALMVWLPVSSVAAQQQGASATPVAGVTATVQATPTKDATVTALEKEKLAQEVQQLKSQNELNLFGWLQENASFLLSTFVVVIGGLIGLWRWFGDRKAERERRDEEQKRWLEDRKAERGKQAEERFQDVCVGLSNEREEAKIGAAITLRTFLRPGYEQFYTQAFDLAVANLRLPRMPQPPGDPDVPLPLTTLSQALIVVFKEAFPLARSQNPGNSQSLDATGNYLLGNDLTLRRQDRRSLESLDATGIQLDNAYLSGTDLEQAWMPRASLRKANLHGAKLGSANLYKADFSKAYLHGADFSDANLHYANLSMAALSGADLSGTDLSGAKLSGAYLGRTKSGRTNLGGTWIILDELTDAYLSGANLNNANLSQADLSGACLGNAHLNKARLSQANLSGADLSEVEFSGADLSQANLTGANLTGTTLDDALSLKGTNLRGIIGLTKEQLAICKAKGAIIDDDPKTSSSQPTVAAPSPSQCNDAHASSVPSAQVSVPPSDTGLSSTPSTLQPDPQPEEARFLNGNVN